MTTFAWSTITTAQSLQFSPQDALSFDSGESASSIEVNIGVSVTTVTLDGKSAIFQNFWMNGDPSHFLFIDASQLGINATNGPSGATIPGYGGAVSNPLILGDTNDLYVSKINALLDQTQNGGADHVNMGGGDDIVRSGDGADSINGADGNDTLLLGIGDDTGIGGAGDDSLTGDQGDDTLIGGANADTLAGGSGSDQFQGTLEDLNGDRILDFGLGELIKITSQGLVSAADVRLLDIGPDTQIQIDGDNNGSFETTVTLLRQWSGSASVVLTSADGFTNNVISLVNAASTNGSDTLIGGAGADTLDGLAGDDSLLGLSGDDSLMGGPGADYISAGSGNDVIVTGAGTDTVAYTARSDSPAVGYGVVTDFESGSDKLDLTAADQGHALIVYQNQFLGFNSPNADIYFGGDGSSYSNHVQINGDIRPTDILTSTNGLDIQATLFSDTINSGNGADTISGDGGDDLIIGHGGADRLSGGAGNDTFMYEGPSDSPMGAIDQIIDFDSDHDTIRLTDADDGHVLVTYISDEHFIISFGRDSSGNYTNAVDVSRPLRVDDDPGSLKIGNIISSATSLDVVGSTGNDIIEDGDQSIRVDGAAGDDVIYSLGGDDSVTGGAGADTVHIMPFASPPSSPDAFLDFHSGEDKINFDNGSISTVRYFSDHSELSQGADSFHSATLVKVFGDRFLPSDMGQFYGVTSFLDPNGADTLFGGLTNDTIQGVDTDDSIHGGDGYDSLLGQAGADTLNGGGQDDTLDGGGGNDIAIFSGRHDVYRIAALSGGSFSLTDLRSVSPDGTDTLVHVEMFRFADGDFTAQQLLDGPPPPPPPSPPETTPLDDPPTDGATDGPDSSPGSAAADHVGGGDGADWLDGQGGADSLAGGAGNDFIRGGNDNDSVAGGSGADTVNGNLGSDTVAGGDGADVVYGGQGDDVVDGGAGDDSHVNGNIGADLVHGGEGSDTVFGGQGNDSVYGDAGDDRLSGDLGDDVLFGGAGADRFAFAPGKGIDWIGDFNAAEGDRIELPSGTTYTVTTYLGQVVLDLGGGATLGLAGVAAFDPSWLVYA